MPGSSDKLSFSEPVLVREQGRIRRLRGVREAINWISYDSPPEAYALLQETMKLLVLAGVTGLANDVAAARRMLAAALAAAKLD